jgi:hypothetical protein
VYIYFFSYITLVSLVFLNLFVAIILDGYFRTKDQEGHELNGIILGVFQDHWARFDPDATGYIKVQDFGTFMFAMGSPLGWGVEM